MCVLKSVFDCPKNLKKFPTQGVQEFQKATEKKIIKLSDFPHYIQMTRCQQEIRMDFLFIITYPNLLSIHNEITFKICKGTIYQFFNYRRIMKPMTFINSIFICAGQISSIGAPDFQAGFTLQAPEQLSHCSLLLLSAAFHCG